MATYIVIQDIEAEDKFVGPLTLKQFVFFMSGGFFGYLCVALGSQTPFLLVIFGPPALLSFFLAIPWSKEQPTEVWVLAKIRFYFKPKKRIWNQSGFQELVTITAPKKLEKFLTNNLSQVEVESRLKALAETIDSRGWAVKNTSLQNGIAAQSPVSDRLIDPSTIPQAVPEIDIASIPDMLGDQGRPPSAAFDEMILNKDQERKAVMIDKMNRIRQGEPLETINQTPLAVSPPVASLPAMKAQVTTMDEQLLSAELQSKKSSAILAESNLHSLPMARNTSIPENATAITDLGKAQAEMTTPVRPDIIGLARNNDLNVATIAREAQKNDDGEVVISLH